MSAGRHRPPDLPEAVHVSLRRRQHLDGDRRLQLAGLHLSGQLHPRLVHGQMSKPSLGLCPGLGPGLSHKESRCQKLVLFIIFLTCLRVVETEPNTVQLFLTILQLIQLYYGFLNCVLVSSTFGCWVDLIQP